MVKVIQDSISMSMIQEQGALFTLIGLTLPYNYWLAICEFHFWSLMFPLVKLLFCFFFFFWVHINIIIIALCIALHVPESSILQEFVKQNEEDSSTWILQLWYAQDVQFLWYRGQTYTINCLIKEKWFRVEVYWMKLIIQVSALCPDKNRSTLHLYTKVIQMPCGWQACSSSTNHNNWKLKWQVIIIFCAVQSCLLLLKIIMLNIKSFFLSPATYWCLEEINFFANKHIANNYKEWL